MRVLSATLSIVLTIHAAAAATAAQTNHRDILVESQTIRERLLKRNRKLSRSHRQLNNKEHKKHRGDGGKDHHNIHTTAATSTSTAATEASSSAAAAAAAANVRSSSPLTDWQIAELAYALESQTVVPLPPLPVRQIFDGDCSFCPDGLEVEPDVVSSVDSTSCGDAQNVALLLSTGDADCEKLKGAEAECCPSRTSSPTKAVTTPPAPEPTTESPVETAAPTKAPTTAPTKAATTPPVPEPATESPVETAATTIATPPEPTVTEETETTATKAIEEIATTTATEVPATDATMDPIISKVAKAMKPMFQNGSTKSAKSANAKASKTEMVKKQAKMDKNPMAKVHKEAPIDNKKESSSDNTVNSKVGKEDPVVAEEAHVTDSKVGKEHPGSSSSSSIATTTTKGEGGASMYHAKTDKNPTAKTLKKEPSSKEMIMSMPSGKKGGDAKTPSAKKGGDAKTPSTKGEMLSMPYPKGGDAKTKTPSSAKAGKALDIIDAKSSKVAAKAHKAFKDAEFDAKAQKVTNSDNSAVVKKESKVGKVVVEKSGDKRRTQ